MRFRSIIGLTIVFGLGIAVGRGPDLAARAQERKAPPNPYAEMLHVGIVVRDLDEAVRKWRAMGFNDIRVSPPSKGVDLTYHGKPIDLTLKQAFIHRTSP